MKNGQKRSFLQSATRTKRKQTRRAYYTLGLHDISLTAKLTGKKYDDRLETLRIGLLPSLVDGVDPNIVSGACGIIFGLVLPLYMVGIL